MDIETILEMYEDDYNPGSKVPGPRNMYSQGQLVSNTVDGSRPGYSGDNVRKLRSGEEVSNKKTKVFKYPRKNFLGKTNYYKTPQITRTNIEGIPNDVGTKLARLQDGKQYQVSTKDKNYLFKTEKKAVDFYNKNIKKGSGAQIKDTFDKQSKELKEFFKDPKTYKRFYDGPLNSSSIDKIWLNLSAAQKRQAKQLLETQGKNIKEAAKLTKQGYIRVADLADKLGRTTSLELVQSMKNSQKFKKLFPNYLNGMITASNNTKWIKTTPSTLTKLKQWADDPLSSGLRDSTIKNIQTAYKDNKLMNYWKNWKPGTPIDQKLIDSVHGTKGSANTMMQLARTLQGKEPIEGVRKNKFLGDKIMEAVRYKAKEFGEWHTAAYRYAKQDMDNFIPVGKSGNTFNDYYRMLTKSLKEAGLEGFQIDEINALRAGVRGGTQPYSVFSQVLEGKYNMGVKRRFDAENAKNQVKLNKALAMGDNETIKVSKKVLNKKQYIDYVIKLQNDQIDNFFTKVPELKGKISLPKFDLRDPKTVYGSRFDTFDKGVQNAILKNFKQIGYTVDVGKKALTQKELLSKNLLKFAGTITDKCKVGNAEGGRIGFASGSADCLRIAKKGMDEGLSTGKWKSPDQAKMARNIAETAGKISKTGIGARVMAELFGPVALASLPVFETGIAGYDTITNGTPFKEAINKTLLHYALGDKTKADPEKLKKADILKMSDGPEKEMLIGLFSNREDLDRVMNNYKQRASLEQDKELYETVNMGGYGDDGSSVTQAQKQIEAINKKILEDNAQGKDYMTLSRAVDDPYAKGLLESKEGELLAKRDANSLSSRLFGTENPYYTSPNTSYRGEVDPKRIEEMKAKNIGMGDSKLYSRNQIVDFLKTVPDMKVTDETVDFLQTKLNTDYFSNVLNQPGMLGTQYSEGGIASLNVNKK